MIIPDNVTVYMNGRAYCAHVCSFYQNGERLSLSIDTNCFKGGAEVNRVEPPRNREITVVTQASGKSVTITYDPHDAEAVKAAEAWRKALFSAARWTYEEPVTVTFTGQQCRDYQSSPAANDCAKPTPNAIMETVKKNNFYLRKIESPTPYMTYLRRGLKEGETGFLSPVLYIGDGLFYDYIGNFRSFEKSEFWTFASAPGHSATVTPPEPGMTPREYVKDAAQKGFRDMQQHIDRAAAAMEPWTPRKRMAELEKAAEPLRGYLKAHGDPHTSIVVTQDGATETQDEPAAPEPEPDKLDYDPLHDTLIDPLPFEYLCYWEQIAQEYSKVREAWDNGKRARIPRHITSFLSILPKRLSKDQEEAMKAMLRKPDATAPKVDLQELDRAIRDLSGVVKDDQSGLHTYFDGVNMSYVLECLKQFREAAT